MLKRISFVFVLLASLYLQGCIEVGSENGYWDKAEMDKRLVSGWVRSNNSDLIIIRSNDKGGFLEAFDEDNVKIADIRTLRRGEKTYMLARMDMDQAEPAWAMVQYRIVGENGTLIGLNAQNDKMNKIYFPDNVGRSEYVGVFPKLDESTFAKIDTIFRNPEWIKIVAEYKRCDDKCVKFYKNM
ncbi:MAG TPA: hypothetical protein VGF14_04525 [Alphaproteobacteria bacterium]